MAKRKISVGRDTPGAIDEAAPVAEPAPVVKKSDLAWLAEAGIDTKAVAAEWNGSINQGAYAREAVIQLVIDAHGMRVRLMQHARKVLEQAIG